MNQSTETERWLPVVGYEGLYEVSDRGRVLSSARVDALGRSKPTRLLSTSPKPYDYPRITIYRNGVRRKVRVHVLVAEAFIGPRPPGMDVCHNNDDPSDNSVGNLRYDSHHENMRDIGRLGYYLPSHCIHGHAFDEENTIRRKENARRDCRACKRDRQARHYRRVRDARSGAAA